LNARVKAAHTGSEGAPLGVIAEAIQKLSADVRIQKTEISDELQKIISNAESLYQNINTSTQEQATETGRILTDLNTLTERFRVTNETITTLLKKIEKAGWNLANDINGTLSNIHVNDLVTRQINNVRSLLDSIVSQAVELMPGIDFRKNIETLHHMENKYTMESERTIHHSYATIKPNGTGSGYIAKNSMYVEDDTMDNVELF